MTARCSIGVDFGTEPGRVLVLDLESGTELVTHAVRYPHGMIDRLAPETGQRLGPDWALRGALPLEAHVRDKHDNRKHGPDAYYGRR